MVKYAGCCGKDLFEWFRIQNGQWIIRRMYEINEMITKLIYLFINYKIKERYKRKIVMNKQ